jgi:hypothetical protein
LDIRYDDKGLADYNTAMDMINKGNIHADRHGGDSLLETVFIEGWHGGARSSDAGKEDVWGSHPSPGVAHYRARGLVKYPDNPKPKMHRYGKWGRVAFRSESPYQMFADSLDSTESSEFANAWQEISSRNWERMCEDLNKKLNDISDEIYG